MTSSARSRFALCAALLFLGVAPGCGDNAPKGTGQGGASGSSEGGAGVGGNHDASMDTDVRVDADAAMDVTSDQASDRGDASDAADVGDATSDRGDVGGTSGTDGGGGTSGTDGGGGTSGTDGGGGTSGTDGGGSGGGGTGGGGTGGGGTSGTGGGGTGGGGTSGTGGGSAGTGGTSGTGGAAGSTAGTGGGTAGTGGGTAGTGGTAGSTAGTGGADAAAGAGGADAAAGTTGNDAAVDQQPEAPPPPACYSVAFTAPVNGSTLFASADKNANQCSDGFQFDVKIDTGAPNGTDVQLFAGAALVQTVQAAGGKATFTNVTLSAGPTALSIQYPSTQPCTDATTKSNVIVDCSIPTCAITKPVISATHPALNGVASTLGGDRVSATGSPYEAAFEVTTDIPDNQLVALAINDAATPGTVSTVTAHASGGVATFAGVALPSGATYQIQARCTDGNGVVGTSPKGSYPVDATAPDLTLSSPADGDFIGPGALTAGAFPVCGRTTSTDAINLSPGLGARAANYCIVTSGTPICVAATTTGVDTCANLPCPGDAPFDITVTLTDTAGNSTSRLINGVTCSSTLPSVQIVSPVTDAPTFTDPSRHLLAANAPQPFRDQNGGVAGAQTDVVACTSRSGTAALFGGHAGDPSLVQIGASVATTTATALDGCPSGLGFIAKFLGVTLPESSENATTGALTSATRLRVDLTDVSAAVGSSPTLDVWVDSVAPTISLTSPVSFCGSFHQAFATYDTSLQFATNTPLVTLTITNASSTQTLSSPTFSAGVATFSTVSFDQGQNNLAGVAKDPAGNSTALQPQPCTVTAGMAPVVTFTNPLSTNTLCPSTGTDPDCINDRTPGTSGWQGDLTVHAIVAGLPITSGNITFSTGGTTLGTAALNGSGDATLTNVTLLDGDVTITAQTDNIPGNGVGTGQITVIVDLGVPDAPSGLTATIPDEFRRRTSVLLSWTAPADNGAPVAGYEIRYAKVPITSANFDTASVTTAFPFTGNPGAVGSTDSIEVTGLYIENSYYFAIASVDAAGNRSGVISTPTSVAAHFNTTTLTGTSGLANEEAGFSLDGTGDANHDTIPDVLAGAFNGGRVYLWLGSSTFAAGTPSVTITGTGNGFGRGVAFIGDIDEDDFEDLAIGDTLRNRVFIFKGRSTWPATLTEADASYTITTDSTADAGYTSAAFGTSIARLGDFTGDGVADFAIGAPNYSTSGTSTSDFRGKLVIVKGSLTFSSFSLPNTTRAITINGDATATRPFFGTRVVGLGHFYSGGTTLVVSAPGINGVASNNEGHVYAFRGQTGTSGAIALSSFDAHVAGAAATMRIGSAMANLGRRMFGVSSLAAVGLGNLNDISSVPGASGTTFVLSGDETSGPFATNHTFWATAAGNAGVAVIGGGVSGSDATYSLIGSDTPDLVVLGKTYSTLNIVDGSKISGLATPFDSAGADVRVPVPAGWDFTSPAASIVPDINDDGYNDFVISNATTAVPGKIVVFW
jgi:hypothetical protein